jgi:hypothetical protein
MLGRSKLSHHSTSRYGVQNIVAGGWVGFHFFPVPNNTGLQVAFAVLLPVPT